MTKSLYHHCEKHASVTTPSSRIRGFQKKHQVNDFPRWKAASRAYRSNILAKYTKQRLARFSEADDASP